MNADGVVKVILALTIMLFFVGVIALRFFRGEPAYVDGEISAQLIEAWENVLVFIVGALAGSLTKKADE